MAEVKTEFKLPNTKVEIHPIIKTTGFINDKNHRAAFLAPGAKKRYVAPIDITTGRTKKVLTPEEEEHLEEVLFRSLSIHERKDNFWDDFQVLLGKDKVVKDLSDPIQYIEYKVLCLNKNEIAPNRESINNKGTYKYYISNTEDEAVANADKIKQREMLSDLFKELRKNRTKMIRLLEMNGSNISETVSDDFLISEIDKLYVSGPDHKQKAFIAILTDGDFDMRFLIKQAIKKGVIIKNRNKYSIQGGDTIANSEEMLIKFLKNNKNQDVLLMIEEQIKNK